MQGGQGNPRVTGQIKNPDQVRIGDLLIQARIVSPEELVEAMDIASSLGLPIGKVMLMSGYLNQNTLQAAVQLQAMLRDGHLQPEMALNALQIVHTEQYQLMEVLNRLGWAPREQQTETKLGNLLCAAGILSEGDLKDALNTTQETGLPLGRVLYNTGKITEATLWSALNAQVLIRDKRLSREQAITALRAAHERQTSLESLIVDPTNTKPTKTVKLGELLVLAGFVSQSTLMTALEVGLLEEKPIGQVLLVREIITQAVLNTALEVQKLVEQQSLTPIQAAEVLRLSIANKISISQSIAELGLLSARPHETIKLGELLKLAGLINEDDIAEALRLALKNGNLMGKILIATGHIDERMIHAALRCQFMLREGQLRQEQAIIALNYCQRMHCTFEEALGELNWENPVNTPTAS